MKLLAVCTSTKIYGAETVLLHLLKGLQDEGHEVFALTSIWTDGKFAAKLKEWGIPHQSVPLGMVSKRLRWPYPWWTFQVLLRLPELWWKFYRRSRQFRPDRILVTSPQHLHALWFMLGRKPVSMLTQFSPRVGDDATEHLWRRYDSKVDQWIACSCYIKRRLENLGIAPAKVNVVKSATLLPGDVASQQAAPAGATVAILGIVGQIGAWKGHEDLLRAAGLLKIRGYDFRIHIYGEGTSEFKQNLAELAHSLGVESCIVYKGYVESKKELFGGLDICIVPSRFEDPYPTVAMEAASYGVPVVGSDRGGLPELIVDGETGFIVESENPAALAERLETLLNDSDLRSRFGNAAVYRAKTVFQRERMIQDFIAVAVP